MPKKWFHSRDDAGSMLATVIIVGLGTGLCSFLGLAFTSSAYDWIVIAVLATALLMLGLLTSYRYFRNEGPSLGFWNAVARNHREEGLAAQYRPRKVQEGQEKTQVDPNKPITADEVHEIQVTSASTWVPSGGRKDSGP
ncbi:MAG TPA: hypothetical protein EYG03_02325 [Planctomycetes bacterium]|nr:hypothetical protein [Fuerstiella sp.]HIK90814.1 hypothetical protein [Planctomycetota bacterium]